MHTYYEIKEIRDDIFYVVEKSKFNPKTREYAEGLENELRSYDHLLSIIGHGNSNTDLKI